MAALTGLGTLALISTWLLGPAKGLYASEETGDLPPELHYVNKRHVPVAILIAQGALGVGLSLLSPLAALFAFIDPGLAKDANCAAALSDAKTQGAPVKASAVSKAAADDASKAKK